MYLRIICAQSLIIYLGALSLKRLPESPTDADNDLRIVGFKVQLDDDEVYTFTLDKTRSKSVDILSILTCSSDVSITVFSCYRFCKIFPHICFYLSVPNICFIIPMFVFVFGVVESEQKGSLSACLT